MNKLKVLFIIMCLSVGIACESSTEKKEVFNDSEFKREISASEKFLNTVSEVHKKQNFLKEDFVTYKFKLDIEGEKLQAKVTSRTDISEFLVETEAYGNFYFNILDGRFIADNTNKTTEKLVSFVVSNYHLFYAITGADYRYGELEELSFLDQPYYQLALKNQASKKIFPPFFEVFIEQRTHMMKGVKLPHPQKRNELVFLQYDKFITVNRIPVSLQWNIFEEVNQNKMSNPIGGVSITSIKYLKENEVNITESKTIL